MSFLHGQGWWAACDAAYALHQGKPVLVRDNAVVIDGRRVAVEDPRGVLSEARRMAGC